MRHERPALGKGDLPSAAASLGGVAKWLARRRLLERVIGQFVWNFEGRRGGAAQHQHVVRLIQCR